MKTNSLSGLASASISMVLLAACGGSSGDGNGGTRLSDPLGVSSEASNPLASGSSSALSGEAATATFFGATYASVRDLTSSVLDGRPIAFAQTTINAVLSALDLPLNENTTEFMFDCTAGGSGSVSAVDNGAGAGFTYTFEMCQAGESVLDGSYTQIAAIQSDATQSEEVRRNYALDAEAGGNAVTLQGSAHFITANQTSTQAGCPDTTESTAELEFPEMAATNGVDILRIDNLSVSTESTSPAAEASDIDPGCGSLRQASYQDSATIDTQAFGSRFLATRTGRYAVSGIAGYLLADTSTLDAILTVADVDNTDHRMTISASTEQPGTVQVDISEAGTSQSFFDRWSFGL